MLKVGLISLGCAKNSVDAEVILGLLKQAGFSLTDSERDADILIVNTCGFISSAKEESINAILDAAQYKKTASCKALIVTGCLAQRYKDELLAEIPEIDGLIGTGEIPRIVSVVNQAIEGLKPAHVDVPTFIYDHDMPRVISTPRYSAYLKVAEGCNNRCTYCAIPEIRGNYRSRSIESVVAEAKRLGLEGVRELNLIAQDTTRYGLDLYGEYKLGTLLKEINEIDEISWLRILYAYPTHFTDELIEIMAKYDKICKYIDLPLQHADDKILREMNRRGTKYDILKLIEKLRKNIPDIALRTSFIVGFPGETSEDFENLVEFVQTVKFDKMGVFTYSPEEGTGAFEMHGQIPEELKEERRDRLMQIQQAISLEANKSKIGKIIKVLIEGKAEKEQELFVGRTEADAPEVDGIIYVGGRELSPGDIVPVKVTHAYEYDLIGEVINESS